MLQELQESRSPKGAAEGSQGQTAKPCRPWDNFFLPRLRRSLPLIILHVIFLVAIIPSVKPLVVAAKEAQPAEDPQIEQRMQALTQQLRCLVCQNETLADSQADLAEDLRRQIREQMKAGKSDQEIVAFLTQRYGDFVLYRPPVKSTTYLLWFGPFILLLAGAAVLYRYLKRRQELIRERPLTKEERHRAEELLRSQLG
jgi:cytochrome c-type biogenesis protein CcmH